VSPRNPAADQCAIRLRAAVSGLSRRLRSATADVGLISPSKLATLAQVHRGGPMTPTELAAREKVKLQSLTRLLAELEAQGLLTREPHASDARQSVLPLTRAGLAQLKAVARSRESSLATALSQD
jgi:DNA-binding MarR family transcriptional regulator